LGVAVGAYKMGEGSLGRQLANALAPGMIVLADRCFPAKPLWLLYTATGADLLWRVKSNLARRHLRELGDGSYLVNFGKGKPVQARVIEYRRQGHPQLYRLITNLLDPVAAPAQELAVLYSQRWEIELVTREIKCDQLDQAPLRSKTAHGVRQEIYAHCLLHHPQPSTRLYRRCHHPRARPRPDLIHGCDGRPPSQPATCEDGRPKGNCRAHS